MQVGLALKQQMRISPQLVIAGRLLALPSSGLEQAIAAELRQNPALERAQRNARARSGGASDLDPETILRTMAAPASVQDQLMAQARLMAVREEWWVIDRLIGLLDGHGYLRKTPEVVVAELGLPPEVVERCLGVLREMDPPGLGARDLRDCLLRQCDRGSRTSGHEVAQRILSEAWEDFGQQRWKSISRRLGLSAAEVEAGRHFIRHCLYPYPLLLLDAPSAEADVYCSADLIIRREGQDGAIVYTLEVPGAAEFELRISESFELALRATRKVSLSPGEQNWITGHVQEARLFIAGFQQRWTTLRQIGEYLVRYQRAYLEGGPLYLRPLTRVRIARELGLPESTVSRATQSKMVQLPDGRVIPLKNFFDQSLGPKEAIRRLLTGQSKLSDRDIADRLQGAGLNLSRRTVAKYRAQLNIPSSHGRKALSPDNLD